MTTTTTGQRANLSDAVAEEVRAIMGRKRMSGAALARALGVSPMWVSYRLAGRQEIGLNDLQLIAAALGVAVGDLLPRSVTSGSGVTAVYPAPTERPTPKVSRPPDNRPNGHPKPGSLQNNGRTYRVPRGNRP